MKKILILAFVFATVLGLAPHVLADGFTALAPITGLTDSSSVTSVVSSKNLASFFNNLYKFLIGIAGILAVIEIIWGGFEYSTQDSISKKSDGKERITQALLGLVLVLSPYLVFSIINPSILNLSLNLPPINLTVPPATTSSTAGTNTSSCTKDSDCATGYYCITTTGIEKCALKPTSQDGSGVAGESCPCGTGFYCDTGTNKCVSSGNGFY